ncbi:MAG: type II toxin-antitoxin system RelE/ParE family toxin [Anaerolineae bacterium]
MASYRIQWRRSAEKDLRRLPREAVPRILEAVEALSNNPYPPGVRKLVGSEHAYRIREGVYRIVYDVQEEALVIEVIRVRHRKDVYE